MLALLKAFQNYWRHNSGALKDPNDYDEAMAIFVLNAFFKRILNSGVALLNREFALGKKRLDLCAKYKERYYPVEIKIKSSKSLSKSLKQLQDYMDTLGANEGWLVRFDNKTKKPWKDKLTWDTKQIDKNMVIHVVGW